MQNVRKILLLLTAMLFPLNFMLDFLLAHGFEADVYNAVLIRDELAIYNVNSYFFRKIFYTCEFPFDWDLASILEN